MSARTNGRGNRFWDAARLKRLRAMAKEERSLVRESFGVSDATIKRGLALLAAEDAANADSIGATQ